MRPPWIGPPSPWFTPAAGERFLPFEDVTEQVWQTERAKSGKSPWQWIEIQVDRCMRVYGQTPCAASLGVTGDDKCINSWATCQDKSNYAAAPYWLRFGEATSDIPRAFAFDDDGLDGFLPLLRGVSHTPMMPDPGENLGLRVNFEAQLSDAPHHDRGIDPYVSERAYDPMTRSTFFRKLKARFPFYIGRRLRWYQGYITADPSLSDFRRREYVIERMEGPDENGRIKFVAKDVLKLLDNDRAQAPLKSRGKLAVALDATTSYTQIDVTTSDATEYVLKTGESTDYVRLGTEVFQYTGSTVIASGVRLTGVTRSAPSPYTTVKAAHDVGDGVQRCRFFVGTIAEVVRELMVDYGGMDPDFIPFDEWQTEALTWLASDDIQRLVTEPEGVKDLIDEIIGQTLTWAFWFDEIGQKIRFRANRPVDIDDTVVELTDGANLVAGSISIVDEPDRIVNEVQALFGQIDPTKNEDEIDNYRRGLVSVDADSQSTNENGQRRIKRIFGRWHPAANEAVLLRTASRTIAARSKNVMNVQFRLERKDENLGTAQFADLTTLYLIDQLGLAKTTRVQVMRVDASGEEVNYRAREDFFKSNYGRLAPGDLSGLTWENATSEQRIRYMFVANAAGRFTNGDNGKALI